MKNKFLKSTLFQKQTHVVILANNTWDSAQWLKEDVQGFVEKNIKIHQKSWETLMNGKILYNQRYVT